MVKMFEITMPEDVTHGRGYIYSLQYHLVWCTKYRRDVLTSDIADECKHLLSEIADVYQFEIMAMEVMPDHIHLLVNCKPQFCISDMMKIMKGTIARKLFLTHPEIKRKLWGGHMWNPSYFAATVSERSQKQVESYINNQTKE